jgi:hypothetical protein
VWAITQKIGFEMHRKMVISIWFLCTIALPFCAAGTDKLDAAMLKESESPKDCKVIDGKYAVDLQTQTLDERYELYKSLLPPLSGKQAQSFKCGKQRGTIFYYEYSSQADRVEAEKGIRRLLWGEDHSTPEHPEQIAHVENVLIVVSFEKVPDVLLTAIRAKLQKVMNPT